MSVGDSDVSTTSTSVVAPSEFWFSAALSLATSTASWADVVGSDCLASSWSVAVHPAQRVSAKAAAQPNVAMD